MSISLPEGEFRCASCGADVKRRLVRLGRSLAPGGVMSGVRCITPGCPATFTITAHAGTPPTPPQHSNCHCSSKEGHQDIITRFKDKHYGMNPLSDQRSLDAIRKDQEEVLRDLREAIDNPPHTKSMPSGTGGLSDRKEPDIHVLIAIEDAQARRN